MSPVIWRPTDAQYALRHPVPAIAPINPRKDIAPMTAVGIVGIILGLISLKWAFVQMTRQRVAIFLIAYIVHVLSAVAYYQFSQDNLADTGMYYYDYYGYANDGFGVSTLFIVYVTQTIKSVFGGSYLDHFLLWQSVGFFGIALLMRIFEEIYLELGLPQPWYVFAILFLPGMHFWTAAIGKDAPLFFAVCLATWATMRLKTRYLGLLGSILLMLLVRPHIALLALAALGIMLTFGRNIRGLGRISVGVLASAGFIFSVLIIRDAYRIDLTDAESLSEFLAIQDNVAHSLDAGNTVVRGGFAINALSLLYRPFFFDAEQLLAVVASFENVILVLITATLLFNVRRAAYLIRKVSFIRFSVVFSMLVLILLALLYYNVGLGLRQRTMFLPGMFILMVAVLASKKAARLGVAMSSSGRLSGVTDGAAAAT